MLKWAAPAALLAVFFLQTLLASRIKSATFDEPAHIAAGLSYLSTGVFHANPQHPPLMKELAAVGLLLGGVRWPKTPTTADIIANPPSGKTTGRDWDAGKEIFAGYGIDRVLSLARLPMILTGVFLGLMIYLWGRELLGETAALGALFLYALDPTIVAHSALVTTDVGLAAFSVAFLYALWKYLQAPSRAGVMWCGVALGCALGAKYTAVFLLPIAAALMLIVAMRRGRAPAVPAAAPNQTCPCGSGKKYKNCHGGAPVSSGSVMNAVPGALKSLGLMSLIALVMIELFYGFRATPFQYLEGLHRVNADHDPNYLAILAGQAQPRFPHYFALAYLLKEPIATILLCLAGAVLLFRGKSAGGAPYFILLPALTFFVIHSLWADNFGVRYVIPALPFLYLAGGAALAWLFSTTASWARVAAVALSAWVVAAAAGIYPDHLSYLNESACVLADPSRLGFDGGSRCGPMWLDDSNVDWGQGMKQLKSWLDVNANGRPVHIMFHASVPPETYGIQYTPPPPSPTGAHDLYVLSAHYVARMALTEERVRTARPIAIVGHAFYIYEF
jgi:hypothetical protein